MSARREMIAPLWAWYSWGNLTREEAEREMARGLACGDISEREQPCVETYRGAHWGCTLWGVKVAGWL